MHNVFTTGEMVNTQEIARRLGVSTRTIATYRKEDRIPYIKLSARTIVYEVAAVGQALKRGIPSQGTGEFIERGRPQQ